MEDFFTKIKMRRAELNMSQDELAKKSSVSRATISKIENNEINPHPRTIYKIANSLKIPIEYPKPDIKGKIIKEGTMVKKRKAKFYNNETSKGFIDFINDEDEMILICPTKEEINWLKNNVVFMPDDKPTKQTYIDLLVIYRKLKKGEYNLEK